MTALRGLLAEARRLEVSVHRARLDDDRLGYYDHERGQVIVGLDVTHRQFLCTLAHELAHAFYGHSCEEDPSDRQARKRAAWLLVDPGHYAAAEALNPDPGAIAAELDLTRKVVEDYRRFWLDPRA